MRTWIDLLVIGWCVLMLALLWWWPAAMWTWSLTAGAGLVLLYALDLRARRR